MNDLITRLRDGKGPDRELDYALCKCFQFEIENVWDAPAFTSELDATLILVEREGFHWMKWWGNQVKVGRPQKITKCYTAYVDAVEAKGNDLCRALLLALLAVKEAQAHDQS